MSIDIVSREELHAGSFREALDLVARERCYLAMVEAPEIEGVLTFIRELSASNGVQVVALEGDRVVGWADISPAGRWETVAHVGKLGMAVLPAYRGMGIGKHLLESCIRQAWGQGLSYTTGSSFG